MNYQPSPGRYAYMEYRRCGHSGLKLPALSLGLWHNFGKQDELERCQRIMYTAFDSGITHFDLANNYGPPPGAAEETFGKILKEDFKAYRDEMIISTKAGYPMWPGPYGDFGSKKYLVASLDQSLKRMGLDYVDIFYHHRPDPETPVEETATALHQIVQQGKALYVGVSNYPPEQTKEINKVLNYLGTPLLIHQPKYSMLVRTPEQDLLDTLEKAGVGCITFSSLAQGLLTGRYLHGIPEDSRAASGRGNGAIDENVITNDLLQKIQQLNALAQQREQTLAQMALAWVLKDKRVTSVVIGASKPEQVLDSTQSLRNLNFSEDELRQIDEIVGS